MVRAVWMFPTGRGAHSSCADLHSACAGCFSAGASFGVDEVASPRWAHQ
jgi:hypothetical protein